MTENKDDRLRELINKFSISLRNPDWIFYLWVIQEKAARKPPTPDIKCYKELLVVRNNNDFRLAYAAFKEVYDYLKIEYGDDLFTKSMHADIEGRYNVYI
jgi:hypothetical protein